MSSTRRSAFGAEFVEKHLKTLDGREIKVLMILLYHRNNQTGRCFPLLKTVVEMSGIDHRRIRRIIKELEEKRWILVDRKPGRRNFYELNCDAHGFLVGKIPDPLADAIAAAVEVFLVGCGAEVECGQLAQDQRSTLQGGGPTDPGGGGPTDPRVGVPQTPSILTENLTENITKKEEAFSNIEKGGKDPHPPAKEKKETPGSRLGKKQKKEYIVFSAKATKKTGNFLNPQQLQALEDFIRENDTAPGDVHAWLRTLEEEE